ncbi:mucin-5AC-like [Betta splendens]|uniref:Mucin-5AC-like n=1 Tax=Betta splendens TaxID=158456 RepID=A0A6P7PC52_BETSP|nr:mucin-5AC-like [Betta splendens]
MVTVCFQPTKQNKLRATHMVTTSFQAVLPFGSVILLPACEENSKSPSSWLIYYVSRVFAVERKVITDSFTVTLCGAQDNTTTANPAPSVPPDVSTTELPGTLPTGSQPVPVTNTTDATGSTNGTTADPNTPTHEANTTSPAPTAEASGGGGLSSGAIAGITIGSIAGVAAVGGGIFGALKYTGRI